MALASVLIGTGLVEAPIITRIGTVTLSDTHAHVIALTNAGYHTTTLADSLAPLALTSNNLVQTVTLTESLAQSVTLTDSQIE